LSCTSLIAALIATALFAVPASAASIPGTDLYRLPIHDGVPDEEATPENLTHRIGYDNQPAFLSGGSELRYTVIDTTGQADIWLLDLVSGTRRSLMQSPTSEYSATSIPGQERFSVVRVEADSTQRVWSFADDGGDARLELPDRPGVGYHSWGQEQELILFILGSPHELHRVRPGVDASELVASDIGRCLQRIPGEDAWSFGQRDDQGRLFIARLDRVSGEITRIAAAPDDSVEDYCWTPDGRLWSSDGTSILEWRDGDPGHWQAMRDLSTTSITGISRMTVDASGSWLVFAADDAPASQDIETVAVQYLSAYNASDENALRAFISEHRDATSLERTPIETRVARQLQMRGMTGALQTVSVAQTSANELELVVFSASAEAHFMLSFEASSLSPVRFAMMGLQPTQAPGSAAVDLDGLLSERIGALRESRQLPALGVAVWTQGDAPVAFLDGVRDVQDKEPVQPGDRFHYGSITKSMTSSIAARLVDRGLIQYETTVADALPGLWMHSGFKAVTLEQFLQHRSGIEPLLEDDLEREKRWKRAGDTGPEQRRALAAELLAVEPSFTPGSSMDYSNAGYAVVSLMLEAASGSSFEELIVAEVFEPLGLESCGLGWPATAERPDQPRGHWPGPILQAMTGYDLGYLFAPAGDVHGSVEDLVGFAHALATGAEGWIQPETLERMFHDPGNGYAMGLQVEAADGRLVLSHNGSAGTFFAFMAFEPATGASAAVVMNEGNLANDTLARSIVRALVEGRLEPR